jgi:hypothetical protein
MLTKCDQKHSCRKMETEKSHRIQGVYLSGAKLALFMRVSQPWRSQTAKRGGGGAEEVGRRKAGRLRAEERWRRAWRSGGAPRRPGWTWEGLASPRGEAARRWAAVGGGLAARAACEAGRNRCASQFSDAGGGAHHNDMEEPSTLEIPVLESWQCDPSA